MRKADLNFAVDLTAFILFLFLISTGLLIYFILPAGSGHLTIWGMNRHAWGDVHFWVAVGFLSMIAVHLILHWNWIISMITRSKSSQPMSKKRLIITLTALIIAILFAVAPYFSSIESTGEKSGDHAAQTERMR